MPTHVYANDEEIACRAADGVATTAFPDPCWSPPPPNGGPALVPYGNVAYARDIINGTATVFIGGQTVAIEDKAYFAASTGNEAATYAFQKGDKTHVIKGKAYFRSWSPDVIFEGLGVDRHTDLVSHNHGSMPSNTPAFPYLSRRFFGGHDCKDEEKRIERACQPDKENSETKKELKGKSKTARMLQKLKKKSGVGRRDKNGWHWTDDHCAGLKIKLISTEQAKEYANEMADLFAALPEELNAMSMLESMLKDLAANAAINAAEKVAAKAAVKQLIGSSAPVAGNIVMGLWSAMDAAMAVGDVREIRAAANEALEQLNALQDKAKELQSLAEEFKGFRERPPEEQLTKLQEIAVEGQDMLATLNACTRARKCNLVPYRADGAGNPFNARKQSKVESSKGGGCCPGQTGHHLIPKAMIESACPRYDHNIAPTVCVEGFSEHFGSHKRIHDAMDRRVKGLADAGKLLNGTMSLEQAIEAAVESHHSAFFASKCSKQCIKAQLESYYNQMCRGSRPKAVDKQGNPIKPERGDSGSD